MAAQLLRAQPSEVAYEVLKRVGAGTWVYVKSCTLHVHTIHDFNPDELHLIWLVTSLGLVSEVRVHTFHITRYDSTRTRFIQIATTPWETVRFILSHIDPGPRVDGHRKIRVTFDDFMYPVIEAWRGRKPYIHLIDRIPEPERKCITTTHDTTKPGIWLQRIVYGYSTESDHEVDVESVSEEDE